MPEGARVAIVANDALGNFVVCTPMLQMLHDQMRPAEVHYFGGNRTAELEAQSDLITHRGGMVFGQPPRQAALTAIECGRFDLVINVEWSYWAKAFTAVVASEDSFVCGPSLGRDGRADLPFQDDERGKLALDQGWIDEDLQERYPFLESGFIGEIFARLAYLEGPVPRYRVPSSEPPITVPDVLIATAASLPEKNWPLKKWREALQVIERMGLSVGLLGAPPKAQREYYKGESDEDVLVTEGLAQDLRGKLSLPQVVGALAAAKAVLTIDNGILHLAVAANTPTVGLFRHGIHRLWAPPFEGLTVLTPGEGRQVSQIETDSVLEAMRRVL